MKQPSPHLVDGSILQMAVAVKLLNNAILIRLRQINMCGCILKPADQFINGVFLLYTRFPFRIFQQLRRRLEYEFRHPVCVRIIVDALMVFVRSDHIPNFIAVSHCPFKQQTVIKVCTFYHGFQTALLQQRLISRYLCIAHDTVHHRGGNMILFVFEIRSLGPPGKYIGHVVIRTCVKAALLALPGIKRSFIAVKDRLLHSTAQSIHPVFHQASGYIRVRKQKEVQHEHFRIPENSSLIRLPRQSPCRDRHVCGMGRRDGQQMIDRIIQRLHRLLVSVYLHFADRPLLLPLPAVHLLQSVIPGRLCLPQRSVRPLQIPVPVL